MQTSLILLICIGLLLLAYVIYNARPRPRYTALLFLCLQSQEQSRHMPAKTLTLRRNIQVDIAPVPGTELSGLGVSPIKVVRVALQEHNPFEVEVHLEPITIDMSYLDGYANDLATDHQWKVLWQK
jgi:hypothetical protein